MSRITQEKVSIAGPLILIALALGGFGWVGNDLLIEYEDERPSDSRGSKVNGYLVNGKRLPTNGANFETFSRFASSYGRTCVHGDLRKAIVGAYEEIFETHPRYQFIYGETGWCSGGSFWPHRTHQHGLSVDFMVPVTQSERAVKTPTTIFDGFGYRNEFDEDGVMGEYRIDFEAMAIHLEALRKHAKKHDLKIERVIFDEPLREQLFKTKEGRRLRKRLTWVEKPVWVRHDDHYHVDFELLRTPPKSTRPKKDAKGEKKRKGGSKK